jgi:hypothetical protein
MHEFLEFASLDDDRLDLSRSQCPRRRVGLQPDDGLQAPATWFCAWPTTRTESQPDPVESRSADLARPPGPSRKPGGLRRKVAVSPSGTNSATSRSASVLSGPAAAASRQVGDRLLDTSHLVRVAQTPAKRGEDAAR